jgi:flagellar motor switch protein FliG
MTAQRKAENRSGTERAAILLLSLGEQEAAEVMKHMGAKDVQRIGAAMTQLQNVSRQEVTEVLQEFTTTVENQTSLGVGVDDYLRKVLISALGEEKAAGLIDRILFGRTSKGLESLKWMDARAVAELIRQEHPQIIAIVLAYLDPDQSADVLAQFPEWLRADVIIRIATLDGIQPHALHELDDVIEKTFSGKKGALKTSIIGGIKTASNILNFMDASQESVLIEHIKKVDEQLGTKIQDLMFVFSDLIQVDDRSIQEILRAIPSERLLVALKGADEALRVKIFKNMSQRAAIWKRSAQCVCRKSKLRRRRFSPSFARWPSKARSRSAERARRTYDGQRLQATGYRRRAAGDGRQASRGSDARVRRLHGANFMVRTRILAVARCV